MWKDFFLVLSFAVKFGRRRDLVSSAEDTAGIFPNLKECLGERDGLKREEARYGIYIVYNYT